MKITEKINFKQPKYMLPAIVYIPLLATGYFVCDSKLVFNRTCSLKDSYKPV